MVDKKTVYTILTLVWNLIKDNLITGKPNTEHTWDYVSEVSQAQSNEVEEKYGAPESKLYANLYFALADYIGSKEDK